MLFFFEGPSFLLQNKHFLFSTFALMFYSGSRANQQLSNHVEAKNED